MILKTCKNLPQVSDVAHGPLVIKIIYMIIYIINNMQRKSALSICYPYKFLNMYTVTKFNLIYLAPNIKDNLIFFRFKKENLEKLDLNLRAQYSGQAVASWLGFRLQMMGVVMVTGIAFISVLQHHFQAVNAGM